MSKATQALETVQTAYAAFGRGDVPTIVSMLSEKFEWKFIGAKGLAYTGSFNTAEQVGNWFADVARLDDITHFEPREFISGEAGHVTVLGWERTRAQPGGKVFECEWAHVFTVTEGRISRFWGIYDTQASAAAR